MKDLDIILKELEEAKYNLGPDDHHTQRLQIKLFDYLRDRLSKSTEDIPINAVAPFEYPLLPRGDFDDLWPDISSQFSEVESKGTRGMRNLPDWIDAFLTLTDNTEPPVQFRRWTAISVVAAALRRKVWTNWGFEKVYPNMYIVLVAPPGACRKGTAMGYGKMFLTDLGIRITAESTTREALIRALKKSIEQTFIEGVTAPIAHCSLTVFSKELTVFLGYNNPDFLSTLTDWFDCEDEWKYDTVSRSEEKIYGVWVNLIGATTPGLIQSSMPRDAIGGGLTSRIIFIYEDKKYKIVPAPFISDEEQELKKLMIHDLTEIQMLAGPFKMTERFHKAYTDFYIEQETSTQRRDPQLENYYERRMTHLRKLCMILSASRSNDMVMDLRDFERAVAYLSEAEKRMAETFTGVGKSDIAELIARVRSTLAIRGSMKFSEILAHYCNDADDFTMKRVVATMVAAGFATTSDNGRDTMIHYKKAF